MSVRTFSRSYGSHLAFYHDVYGHAVHEARPAGRTGAMMFRTEQGAGDWSDAPTPDLVINLLHSVELSGVLDCGGGRRRMRMREHQFIVAPPRYATTFLLDTPHRCSFLAIPYARLLDLAGEGAGLPADGNFGRLHDDPQQDAKVGLLLAHLWAESADGSPSGALWADGALLQLAARLLRLREGPKEPPRGGLAPWQQRRATEYLADHLAEDVTLEALAAVAGLSPFHFARMFKRSTGLPPHAYLRRLRCERAKALLEGTALSIGAVAAEVGYETPQAFARMFRAGTGMSPTEWRRERRAPGLLEGTGPDHPAPWGGG